MGVKRGIERCPVFRLSPNYIEIKAVYKASNEAQGEQYDSFVDVGHGFKKRFYIRCSSHRYP